MTTLHIPGTKQSQIFRPLNIQIQTNKKIKIQTYKFDKPLKLHFWQELIPIKLKIVLDYDPKCI